MAMAHPHAARDSTFEAIARAWFGVHKSEWAPKHADKVIRRMEMDVFSRIGKVPITDITPLLLLDVARRIETRGVQAAAATRYCRPMGGAEHASEVTRAVQSVSYCAGRPERSTSNTASSAPPFKYAARARHTAPRPIPQHGHDLGFGNPASQAGPDMGSLDVSRMMQTFAANLFDDRAVLLGQLQLRPAHDNISVSRVALAGV
jgi:hypothetical protein